VAAFTLHSEEHTTASSVPQVFLFLSDFKNFESILPEDRVSNFQYKGDACSFDIKGMTPLQIRLADKKENKYLLFATEGLARFNFNLKVIFSDTTCRVELSGDMNPIIKSMAEKPLSGLINTMSLRLSQLQIT
jgi:hypothetical protein